MKRAPSMSEASDTTAPDGDDNALGALREKWKHTYDVGTVTVPSRTGPPVLLWVAVRLEGGKPEPLLGFTPEALGAAISDDQGETP